MSISADTLQLLMQAGLQGEALLAVVRSIEADNSKPARSAGAERQRRYRENKKATNRECDVTRDVTRDASPDPSFLSLSPTPPIPNQSTPVSPPYSPPPLDEIWQITPKIGRERSSRKDLDRALTAAVRRGHDPAAILAGVKAYYASDDATRDGGQFAKGVHRVVENDRWQSYASEARPIDWENMVAAWRATGRWPKSLGPPPDHPETQVPPTLRAA